MFAFLKQGTLLLILLTCVSSFSNASVTELKETVAFAGVTFMGSKQSDFKLLYPYSYQIAESQNLNAITFKLLQKYAPKNFKVSPTLLNKTDGYKYALALMIDDESVSVETAQTYDYTGYKVVPYISAQLIFFDVEKSQFISSVHLPPIVSAAKLFKKAPTDTEKYALVSDLINSSIEQSLVNQFVKAVQHANRLKRSKLFTFSVSKVDIQDKANHALPEMLKADQHRLLKPYIAQKLLKNLSVSQNIATQPYGVDASTLIMRGRFTGGESVYQIALTPPTFAIEYTLRGFNKFTLAEREDIGKRDVYGSFSNVKVVQNGRNPKVIFSQDLKTGVSKVIPEGKTVIDEWAVYRESLLSLLQKSTSALHLKSSKFYQHHNFSRKDKKQIAALEGAYEKCRF